MNEPEVTGTRLDQVTEREQKWLWPERIPAGALTIIAGDPSASKSTLSLDIISRVTTGVAWPDGAGRAKTANVVLVQAEDDLATCVVPRLRVAGGDPAGVFTVDGIQMPRATNPGVFTLLHCDALRRKIEEVSASLVVIDPIGAFMGKVDGNDASAVRGALLPLQLLAKETGAAVVAIAHPNKGGGNPRAMHRIAGSLAMVAAARAAWWVVEDRDDEERRLFLRAKMNLSKDAGGLAYRVVDEGGHPRIAWELGRVDITADEYLAEPDTTGKVEEAEAWLLKVLSSGPVASADLAAMAKRDRHAWRTVKRARGNLREIHVRQTREGWEWVLIEIPPAFERGGA